MASKFFIPGWRSLVEEVGVPGIAALVLLPILIPVTSSIAKPLAKETIKAGLFVYEKSKEAIDEVNQSFENLVAEAKAELTEAQPKSLKLTEIQVEGN